MALEEPLLYCLGLFRHETYGMTRLQGKLSNIPFSQLLSRLWQTEKSGLLKIKNVRSEKHLSFKKGNIAIERASFPGKDFLKNLVEKKILDSSSAKEYESFAAQNKRTIIRALHELRAISPPRLWILIEDFIKSDYSLLFDWTEGEFEFVSEKAPQEPEILFLILTPDFILQGIRQMENYDIIRAHIPPEDEIVQILSPEYLNVIALDSPEKYLLAMIDNKKSLKNIYDLSELGKKESQKVIFCLFSLGLIAHPQDKIQDNSYHKPRQLELDKILDVFNNKLSYTYKFISKELGPVAFNVVEKCLKETTSHLSSLFPEIKFDEEGRIDMDAILKTNRALATEGTMMNLIKDLNEILMAEVLAVKKNLGDEHETLLIKNLEKIGEES